VSGLAAFSKRVGARGSWRVALAAALVVAVLCAAPRAALSGRGAGPSGGARPRIGADRAFTTDGLVFLRAPGSTMVRIPASTFIMGSSPIDVIEAAVECGRDGLGERCKETLFAHEMPQRRVRLAAYWIDRTEVTVAAYERCVALGHCRPLPYRAGAMRFYHPDYPVTLVTYEDARAYCQFRNARLPTEAEFERAARGPSGRRYPWGDLYNSRASNHGRPGLSTTDPSDGFEELAPVGAYPEGGTPEGVLDLAGNVSEWVYDRYAPSYPDGPAVNPTGPPAASGGAAPAPSAHGSPRVLRGGDFRSASAWLRGAARNAADPNVRAPYIGFRCARSAE